MAATQDKNKLSIRKWSISNVSFDNRIIATIQIIKSNTNKIMNGQLPIQIVILSDAFCPKLVGRNIERTFFLITSFFFII